MYIISAYNLPGCPDAYAKSFANNHHTAVKIAVNYRLAGYKNINIRRTPK